MIVKFRALCKRPKKVRTFKLNAERQNGRAAMLGITGCLIHELLGVDALYPTGGLGGAAPPPIIAALAVQGRAGSVQMFSEGCARFLIFLFFDMLALYPRIIVSSIIVVEHLPIELDRRHWYCPSIVCSTTHM